MVANLQDSLWGVIIYNYIFLYNCSLEKEMATHSSILTGEFHGQKSLTGYSPWCCKKSDTTERPSLTHMYNCHILYILLLYNYILLRKYLVNSQYSIYFLLLIYYHYLVNYFLIAFVVFLLVWLFFS